MFLGLVSKGRNSLRGPTSTLRDFSFRCNGNLKVGNTVYLERFNQKSGGMFSSGLIGTGLDRKKSFTLSHNNYKPPKRVQRLVILSAFFLLWMVGVVYRLVDLAGPGYERWAKLAASQHSQTVEILGARGNILDRAGRKLAVSVESLSIGAHPSKIENIDQAATILAKELKQSRKVLLSKLHSNASFVWLARGVSPELRPDLSALDSRAFEIETSFQRSYPHGTLASPVIGRVGRDGRGQAGVELALEGDLSVDHELLELARDAKGRLVKRTDGKRVETKRTDVQQIDKKSGNEGMLSLVEAKQIVNSIVSFRLVPGMENADTTRSQDLRSQGSDVTLTIDAVIQEILESELQRGQEDAVARQAFGIVLDSLTGDVLALGQSVRFDPNRLFDVSPADMKNIALQNVFEPGSTFKPIVAAIGLEEGVVSSTELIDCENGSFFVGGHMVRDVHPSGLSTVREVLVHSSNIGMTKIGRKVGASKLYRNLRLFGFGELVDIGLPGIEKGLLRDPSDWREIDLATASFGQSVGVNALQLAQAYGVIANGGILVAPKLVHNDRNASEQDIIRRVISQKTAEEVAGALQGVVEDDDGTGGKAAITGVTVYGKTGTAQKARTGSRGYDPDAVQASFVGFVRGSELGIKGNLVMVIVIDEPSVKPRWGGVVAAPVFQRAMNRIISHLVATEGIVARENSV